MLGSARGEAMRAAQRCEDVAVPLVAWGGENPRVPNAEKRPVGRFSDALPSFTTPFVVAWRRGGAARPCVHGE